MKFRHFLPIALLLGGLVGLLYARAELLLQRAHANLLGSSFTPPAPSSVSPDGSIIFGNTGGTLNTLHGTWDFGDQYAPPGPDGNIYRYPRLNGREILETGGIEANMMAFRRMIVDNGGNLYGLTFSSIYTRIPRIEQRFRAFGFGFWYNIQYLIGVGWGG
jgi:hypothetical protein